MGTKAVHLAAVVRVAVGFGLTLGASSMVQKVVAGASPVVSPAVRALGVRDAVQGVLILRRPDGPAIALGALLDGAHAASMLALACASVKYRRLALMAFTEATLAFFVSLSALGPQPRRSG